ncbi:hypothetical protein LENED_006307 [Lentinula edodes]|uniref:Uncharacterized protein n=1 Tax=Lentinula edodes TaxID=5353 RepID=A0A1Q3EBG4_LENED|nr:hypothetical protein LENED_006307 [Lentinula edodes]
MDTDVGVMQKFEIRANFTQLDKLDKREEDKNLQDEWSFARRHLGRTCLPDPEHLYIIGRLMSRGYRSVWESKRTNNVLRIQEGAIRNF